MADINVVEVLGAADRGQTRQGAAAVQAVVKEMSGREYLDIRIYANGSHTAKGIFLRAEEIPWVIEMAEAFLARQKEEVA